MFFYPKIIFWLASLILLCLNVFVFFNPKIIFDAWCLNLLLDTWYLLLDMWYLILGTWYLFLCFFYPKIISWPAALSLPCLNVFVFFNPKIIFCWWATALLSFNVHRSVNSNSTFSFFSLHSFVDWSGVEVGIFFIRDLFSSYLIFSIISARSLILVYFHLLRWC